MSTIYCSDSQCIYQKDGVCELNTIAITPLTNKTNSSCLYFKEKNIKNSESLKQSL